jgi:hypothetical protein
MSSPLKWLAEFWKLEMEKMLEGWRNDVIFDAE